MCEFLERMRLTGTPTEEVRKWSGMTHRVVELTGPFPTPDEMRVELWLHEESATRLLDMCDRIDAEFHKIQAENANLRELLLEAYNTARGLALNDPLADVSWLADRIRELGVEVR